MKKVKVKEIKNKFEVNKLVSYILNNSDKIIYILLIILSVSSLIKIFNIFGNFNSNLLSSIYNIILIFYYIMMCLTGWLLYNIYILDKSEHKELCNISFIVSIILLLLKYLIAFLYSLLNFGFSLSSFINSAVNLINEGVILIIFFILILKESKLK